MLKLSISKLNKKGISAIVATIAIVMITIAAAAFIAGIVVPLVKNRLGEGTECIGYERHFVFSDEFGYNCYINQSDRFYYAFSVQANSLSNEKEANLKGLRVNFLTNGESVGVDILDGQASDAQEIRMLNGSVAQIKIPSQGGIRTYVFNSTQRYDSIELYPILKNGRVCEKNEDLRVNGIICTNNLDLR